MTLEPVPFRWSRAWWGLALMLLAVAMIPFAEGTWAVVYPALRRFSHAGWGWVFNKAEDFPNPRLIVPACLLALWWKRREAVPFVVALVIAMLLGTVLSNTLKNAFSRARPYFGVMLHDLRDREDSIEDIAFIHEWNARHPRATISLRNEDKWLVTTFPRPWFKVGFGSFPSAHARNAFVFAAFLTLLLPRLGPVWVLMAAVCALSRVHDTKHYLEDVLFGAGLGWLLMHWIASWHWPLRHVERALDRLPPRARAWLGGQ